MEYGIGRFWRQNGSLRRRKGFLRRQVGILLAALLAIGGVLNGIGIAVNASPANDHLVISQVYGAGGNGTGASFRQDFIELYNPTNQDISLNGFKLLYASATGAWPESGNNVMALSGTIGAGEYYLTGQAAGNDTSAPDLSQPDAVGQLNMAGASGKVKLVDGNQATIDMVGYGTASEFEGAGPTEALTNVTAAIRKSLNLTDRGLDTDHNGSDFSTGVPSPRNSAFGSAAEAVTAQPGPGIVTAGTQVVLATATEGAVIYYRVNADEPSDEFMTYSEPITVSQASTIEAYAAKDGMENSDTTSFAYTISDVMPIAEARELAGGTAALIEGTVTYREAAGGQMNLYVQDGTAGIVVRGSGLTAEAGDIITASGTVQPYYDLAQLLVGTGGVSIKQANAGVPEPQPIQSTDLGEGVEAELVSVSQVTAGAGNQYNEFTVTDAAGSFVIKSPLLETGKTYERIVGVVTYAFGRYMIVPRSAFDISEKVLSVTADPPPGDLLQSGTEVALSTPAAGGSIYFTTDGTEPSAAEMYVYTAPIAISEDTVIKAIVAADRQTSETFTFSYKLQQSYNGLKIHDIQAAAHISPYAGHAVTAVEGIVTAKRSDGKWYMQAAEADWDDNDATSEAVLVEPKAAAAVSPGDRVTVAGTVQEVKEKGYADAKDLTTTQIAASSIIVTSSGQALPQPVIVGEGRLAPAGVIDNDGMSAFDPDEDALDFYESLEGMRVQVNDANIVGPFNYEIPVVSGALLDEVARTPAGGIILTGDGYPVQRILIAKEPSQQVKTGDRFTGPVTGVMSYDYSNYKIIPDSLPSVEEGDHQREISSLEPDEDKLTIATFNIENFWDNPSGAEQARKNNIAKAIVGNLHSPDIVALVEVQDNDGAANSGVTDASASYSALIAAIEANGGPQYSYTDIAPENNKDGGEAGGNIRVGYLYNEARVTLVEKAAGKGAATTAVQYEADGLSHNPGRIDPGNDAFKDSRKPLAAEFEFNGERLVVIAGHFNSKGGDEAPFGAVQPLPETLGSEVQRHQIAGVVNGFVQSIFEKNADANVVVLGDLNDFPFSRTLELTKGSGLTNLVDTLPVNERYSYIYQGVSQTLDHILADKELAEFTEFDIVHINADFDEEQGRVSDHDPLVAQLDLAGKKAAAFSMTLMHVNDTHAHLENVAQRITAIKEVRAREENSILLDAGDVFSGTLYFNKYLGQADLAFMNAIGFDAMTFGNHEFDKGPGVLADFVKAAEFPFVSANVDVSKEPELSGLVAEQPADGPPADGKIHEAIVLEVGGEKVGVFGLTTEDTKFLSSPGENIAFGNYLEEAESAVAELTEAGVNKIIALTHLGYEFDRILADEVEGIDVIVGGHSHTRLPEPVEILNDGVPTIILQAEDYGKFLGRAQLEFDRNGVLTGWEGELLDTSKYTADEDALAMLAPYNDGVADIKAQVIGRTDVFLDGERNNVRSKETNLGNLMTDGMLAKVKSIPEFRAMEGIKGFVAIQNGGGIRASIPTTADNKADGDITLGELLTMMPFGNNLTALRMTGREIALALENGVSGVETGQGRFPHVSGMRYVYDSSKKPEIQDTSGNVTQTGERIVKVEVKNSDGTYSAIDPEGYYFVATNSFMANGGDFYRSMKAAKDDGRQHEMNIVDYEVFWEHLDAVGTVKLGTEGRIADLKGGTTPTPTPASTPTPTPMPISTPVPTATPTPTTTAPSPSPDPAPEVEFSDVGSHWAARLIEEAILAEVVIGYGDGTFRPEEAATRAEFVTMLGRALKLEAAGGELGFADAGDVPAWARGYFAALAADNAISGYEDGTLRPGNPLTRTEMTVILVRALGIEPDPAAAASIPFADAGDIPLWARSSIAAAHAAGLIDGIGGNLFAPGETVTRANVVELLLKVIDLQKI